MCIRWQMMMDDTWWWWWWWWWCRPLTWYDDENRRAPRRWWHGFFFLGGCDLLRETSRHITLATPTNHQSDGKWPRKMWILSWFMHARSSKHKIYFFPEPLMMSIYISAQLVFHDILSLSGAWQRDASRLRLPNTTESLCIHKPFLLQHRSGPCSLVIAHQK